MADLGRAALPSPSGSPSTRRSAEVYAACIGAAAGLLESARNALFAAFAASAVAALVLLNAFHAPRLHVHVRRRPLEPRAAVPVHVYTAFWGGQEGSLLLWLLRADRARLGAVAPDLTREVLPWTVPVLGGVATFFAFLLVFVASPFATQVAPRRRRGPEPEPPEPVHDDPPAAPLPRLRRPDDPVRVRRRARCSRAASTSAGSSPRAAGRWSPGRRSGSGSCSAPSGPTKRSAGAATTPGTRSRTRR